jgi:hypothetical protein
MPEAIGPEMDTLCTLSELVALVLLRMTFRVRLEKSNAPSILKFTREGWRATWVATVPTPIPDSGDVKPVNGKSNPGSILVMASVPGILPLVVGWNETLMVQLWPLPKVAGQLLFCK